MVLKALNVLNLSGFRFPILASLYFYMVQINMHLLLGMKIKMHMEAVLGFVPRIVLASFSWLFHRTIIECFALLKRKFILVKINLWVRLVFST